MRNFVARELAMIGSIDGALAMETEPELVPLLLYLKEGHQDAHGRLAALARMEHRALPRPWPLASVVMELEGRIARTLGAARNLDALHGLERSFEHAYVETRDQSEGLRREVVDHLARRAAQRVRVLEHRGAHVCGRCLLDRPGAAPALLREQPHIYLCAACHVEVRSSVPEDLARQLDVWPPEVRDSHMIERGLSRPSKDRARDTVHTELAGQPIVEHVRARPQREPHMPLGKPVELPPTVLHVSDGDPLETAYTTWLFDYRSVRARW